MPGLKPGLIQKQQQLPIQWSIRYAQDDES